MIRNQSEHRQLAESFLVRTIHEPDYSPGRVIGCDLLTEGISGASIYRVLFTHGAAILKLTPSTNGQVPIERARRELAFYRQLANRIPLRVPRLLATYDGKDGTALLLAAYEPAPPPQRWPASDYLEAARQLAQLHSAYWGKTDKLSGLHWLKRRLPGETEVEVNNASGYWQALQRKPRFAGILTEQSNTRLFALLSRINEFGDMFRALPLTLCHGDCITANVLKDAEGHFVWADWQEVGLARGPEDLSFLMQRASSAGAAVPYEEMLNEYCEALELGVGESVSRPAIRRVVDASELWSRLLYWPAYMTQTPAEQLRNMVERIFSLARRLELIGRGA